MAAISAFIPGRHLLAPINPNPQPVVKLGYELFRDVEGFDKVSKCAISAINFLSAVTPSLPAYLPILGSLLKGTVEVLIPFQFFKVAKEWTEFNNKNLAGKASLVGITAIATIGIGRFLEKIQLFNMTAAVSKLGNVPVLGHIVNVPFGALTAGVSVFSAIDGGIKFRNINRPFGPAHEATAKLEKWSRRQIAVAAFDKQTLSKTSHESGFQAIPVWNEASLGAGLSKKATAADKAANQARLEAALGQAEPAAVQAAAEKAAAEVNNKFAEERTAKITTKTALLFQSHPTAVDANSLDAVHAYTAYKVRKWTAVVDTSKTESNKALFTITSEVSKFALIVLGLIGASFSIAALAMSSIPMFALAVIVTSIAVAKKVYDTRHKEAYVPVHPDNFEEAVITRYHQAKMVAKAEGKL